MLILLFISFLLLILIGIDVGLSMVLSPWGRSSFPSP
jgi:hypothetical protein